MGSMEALNAHKIVELHVLVLHIVQSFKRIMIKRFCDIIMKFINFFYKIIAKNNNQFS